MKKKKIISLQIKKEEDNECSCMYTATVRVYTHM